MNMWPWIKNEKEKQFGDYLERKWYKYEPDIHWPVNYLIYPLTEEVWAAIQNRIKLPHQPDFVLLNDPIVISEDVVAQNDNGTTKCVFFHFDNNEWVKTIPYSDGDTRKVVKTDIFNTRDNPVFIKR